MTTNAESILKELASITMSDGVDVYVVARALTEGFKKGENFKVDSLGNMVDKYSNGYSVQVIPNIAIEEGKELISVIKFMLANRLVLTVVFTTDGFALGFVNHFDLEADCRMFCKEVGCTTYVDHAFNVKHQTLFLSFIPPRSEER